MQVILDQVHLDQPPAAQSFGVAHRLVSSFDVVSGSVAAQWDVVHFVHDISDGEAPVEIDDGHLGEATESAFQSTTHLGH